MRNSTTKQISTPLRFFVDMVPAFGLHFGPQPDGVVGSGPTSRVPSLWAQQAGPRSVTPEGYSGPVTFATRGV